MADAVETEPLRFLSVELDPARGSEANKRRPAVIVSNDAANATAGRLGRVVPHAIMLDIDEALRLHLAL